MSVEAQTEAGNSPGLKVDASGETGEAMASKASSAMPVANAGSTEGNNNAASQVLPEQMNQFKNFGNKEKKKPLIIHRDAHSIVLAGHQLMYKTPRVSSTFSILKMTHSDVHIPD